jgi:VWFA-related protein
LIDSLNTSLGDNYRLRGQALRYLRALAPDTRVAIFHLGAKLTVVHDFTDDASSLRQQLEQSNIGTPPGLHPTVDSSMAEAEAILASLRSEPRLHEMTERMLRGQMEAEQQANAAALGNRLAYTLGGLEALGNHLAGIPGRKNLIWITGGLPIFTMSGMVAGGPSTVMQSFSQAVRATSQQLAQQNIALYVVDARGLLTSPVADTMAIVRHPPGRGGEVRTLFDGMISGESRLMFEMMASVTGGRHLYNTNDLLEGYKAALRDVRGSYTIGFYAPEVQEAEWRDLKVTLKRPGLKVLHRKGYFAEPLKVASGAWPPRRWDEAFRNPLGSTAIPLIARVDREREAGGEEAFLLKAWIDPSVLSLAAEQGIRRGAIEIGVAERTATGLYQNSMETGQIALNGEQWGLAVRHGIPYQRRWKPMEGVATVRVVVRDKATGNYGSVDVPVGR